MCRVTSALRRAVVVIPLAFAASLIACGEAAPPGPTPPEYAQAAAQGVDAVALARAHAALAANPDTRCLLLERNGVLVMEDYFNGSNATSANDVRSVTKSVTAALVGIAIEQGLIRGLDDRIGDYVGRLFPGLEPRKADITVRHLLTMSSGLPWSELNSSYQDFNPWVSSPDPLRWVLERPLERDPGSYWNYNTGASHILSAILSEATGTSARAYSEQHLFGPLEASIGSWPADPRGYNYGGHGLRLTGRTMIQFGRLFLDGGVHRGRQVVSTSWVREATTPAFSVGGVAPNATGYGYLWWVGRDPASGLTFYFASGYGGQFIVNVPSRNATIVAATDIENPRANANWSQVWRTIVDTLLPALR